MIPPKGTIWYNILELQHPSDAFMKLYMLLKNLYGINDAGSTWFDSLKYGLIDRGWEKLTRYTCLWTKSAIIIILYVENASLLSSCKGNIQYEIKSLQETFDLTVNGELKDYLGTRFEKNKQDGPITLTQPRTVEIINHYYHNRVLRLSRVGRGLYPNFMQ